MPKELLIQKIDNRLNRTGEYIHAFPTDADSYALLKDCREALRWNIVRNFPQTGIIVEVLCEDDSIKKAYGKNTDRGFRWYHAKSHNFWSLADSSIISWRTPSPPDNEHD